MTTPTHTSQRRSTAPRLSRIAAACFSAACGLVGTGVNSAALAQCPPTWITGTGPNGAIGSLGTSGGNSGGQINAVVAMDNGDVVVAGTFTSAGSVNSKSLALYRPSTNTWYSTNPPQPSPPNGVINAMVKYTDDLVVVCGDFTTWGGASMPRIAIVNPYLTAVSSVGGGLTGTVNALAVLSNGDIIAGGSFSNIEGNANADNVVRFNTATGHWVPIGTGLNGPVYSLAVLPGDEIVAGGQFNAGSQGGTNISRFRPSTGLWTRIGTNTPAGPVLTIAQLPGNELVVGGQFSNVDGVANSANIARCNFVTGVWSSCQSGIPGSGLTGVFSTLVIPSVAGAYGGSGSGSEVLVGGLFPVGGGIGQARYSRFNDTVTYFPTSLSVDGTVRSMTMLSDGSVVVAGRFNSIGGTTQSHNIARFTPGTAPPSLLGQPMPVNTYRSGTAYLNVTVLPAANTGALLYQWRHDGVPIDAAANPSAATAILTLTNVQQADLGLYDCFITNSCGGAGPTSAAAAVSFVIDPCPADMGVQGGGFGHDGMLDNNDFISFINKFFNGCTP
ncbi:MAG: immunoglobulin domain-containing protein [Phycisphaerales bacterium]